MGLAERVDQLPREPGVYLFKSRAGAVLYVGKAQNLRSRVRQYIAGGAERAAGSIAIEVDQFHDRARPK